VLRLQGVHRVETAVTTAATGSNGRTKLTAAAT